MCVAARSCFIGLGCKSRSRTVLYFFFQAADGIRDTSVTGVPDVCSSDLAALYGLGLAIPAFLALSMFIDYKDSPVGVAAPLINLGLLALVWWCSHQLTRDCTHLDEDRKSVV